MYEFYNDILRESLKAKFVFLKSANREQRSWNDLTSSPGIDIKLRRVDLYSVNVTTRQTWKIVKTHLYVFSKNVQATSVMDDINEKSFFVLASVHLSDS